MRKLSSLITGAALTLVVGSLGCISIDPEDPFDSLTTLANETTGDGDGDPTTGDGDGDPAGDGDGDPTTTGDGDGDACGGLGDGCAVDTDCCDGFACNPDGTCGFPTGDGDGDPTTGGGDDPWNPETCMDPSIPVMIGMIPGAICSAPCMSDADCPAGPPGSTAGCFLIADGGMNPTNCALACPVGMDAACPAGSTCKDLMDPNNPDLGLCTYP